MDNNDSSSNDQESRGTISITKPFLLLVEGKDDLHFFIAFANKLDLEDIQIEYFGGKDSLRNRLEQYVIHPDFHNVKSLGIVRDANSDPNPFGRVTSALKKSGLEPPKHPLEPSGEDPRITIMIFPGEGQTGELEDLCLKSLSDDMAMVCVDRYIACLKDLNEKEGLPLPKSESKAKLHAFLSSREEPGKPIGLSVKKGYIPSNSSAFDEVKKFLMQVACRE